MNDLSKMYRDMIRLKHTYEEIVQRWKESKSYCKTEIGEIELQARIDTLEEVIQDLDEIIKDK